MAGETSDLHRHFGMMLFNRCWELIETTDRTTDQDVEMLLSATTSRWHWAQIGGPEQIATGDWQAAHAASLLGMSDLALLFAERNLAIATSEGWNGWRLASAYEGMARAGTAAGDADRRRHHMTRAREGPERESDAESRRLIADQLATIPAIDELSSTAQESE